MHGDPRRAPAVRNVRATARPRGGSPMVSLLRALRRDGDALPAAVAVRALRAVTSYAIAHPAWFPRVRAALSAAAAHRRDEVAARAGEELDRLRARFTAWIGPNPRRTADPATGEEYGWRDVLSFDPAICERERQVLASAIEDTTLVRTAAFLFGGGARIGLQDLAAGGVRLARLGASPRLTSYLLRVRTRALARFGAVVHVADGVSPPRLDAMVRELLAAGGPPAEAFGGYYPEYGLFTQGVAVSPEPARRVHG
jgi:long-chain acyl-CoA synthetase